MSDADFLRLEQLTLGYGKANAVERLDLAVARGELVALLGPSGCGKSTTMRAIAGLLKPRSGAIRLDGADVTRVAANRREVGLVFQSYALFPHLDVFENLAFGLRLKGFGGVELADRVARGLNSVGLSEFARRKTQALSGGQQQRVALARALVMEPKLLLLDEPLSNLDERLRLDMRAELQRVHRDTGLTMIFVTHDQSEALALADRIVVMRNGAIEQIGTPEQIYNAPVSRFVAEFVGFENVFEVRGGKLANEQGEFTPEGVLPQAEGLAWRPRAVALGAGPHRARVLGVSFAGGTREYVLESAFGRLKAEREAAEPAYALGENLSFDLPIGRAAALQRY